MAEVGGLWVAAKEEVEGVEGVVETDCAAVAGEGVGAVGGHGGGTRARIELEGYGLTRRCITRDLSRYALRSMRNLGDLHHPLQ